MTSFHFSPADDVNLDAVAALEAEAIQARHSHPRDDDDNETPAWLQDQLPPAPTAEELRAQRRRLAQAKQREYRLRQEQGLRQPVDQTAAQHVQHFVVSDSTKQAPPAPAPSRRPARQQTLAHLLGPHAVARPEANTNAFPQQPQASVNLFCQTFNRDCADMDGTPRIDATLAATWLYPKNVQFRQYQFDMARASLFRNNFVVLPTGLGKTLIAAVVLANFLRWFPRGRVIFLAPTRPLVAQQQRACQNVTGMKPDDMVVLDGNVMPAKRRRLWRTKRAIFATPQVVRNDVENIIADARTVVCCVVDEAHRSTGENGNVMAVQALTSINPRIRIMALSATPCHNMDALRTVIGNLRIAAVDIRQEDDPEIKKHTHGSVDELVVVSMGPHIQNTLDSLACVMEDVLAGLTRHKAMFAANVRTVAPFTILSAQKKFAARQGEMDKGLYWSLVGDFGALQTLVRARDALCNYSFTSFHDALVDNIIKGKSKAKQRIGSSPAFQRLLSNAQVLLRDDFVHPKMIQLQSIVEGHFSSVQQGMSQPLSNASPRTGNQRRTRGAVIIFTQFRDSVQAIVAHLKKTTPAARPSPFVGQSTNKKTKGQSQKKQQETLRRFKSGQYNILVATSVGEEGLDIGEVDLIINFDNVKSAVRSVQRRGRTGRRRAGRCINLVSEGKERENYEASMEKAKSIQKTMARPKMRDSLPLFRDTKETHALPRQLKPVPVQFTFRGTAGAGTARGAAESPDEVARDQGRGSDHDGDLGQVGVERYADDRGPYLDPEEDAFYARVAGQTRGARGLDMTLQRRSTRLARQGALRQAAAHFFARRHVSAYGPRSRSLFHMVQSIRKISDGSVVPEMPRSKVTLPKVGTICAPRPKESATRDKVPKAKASKVVAPTREPSPPPFSPSLIPEPVDTQDEFDDFDAELAAVGLASATKKKKKESIQVRPVADVSVLLGSQPQDGDLFSPLADARPDVALDEMPPSLFSPPDGGENVLDLKPPTPPPGLFDADDVIPTVAEAVSEGPSKVPSMPVSVPLDQGLHALLEPGANHAEEAPKVTTTALSRVSDPVSVPQPVSRVPEPEAPLVPSRRASSEAPASLPVIRGRYRKRRVIMSQSSAEEGAGQEDMKQPEPNAHTEPVAATQPVRLKRLRREKDKDKEAMVSNRKRLRTDHGPTHTPSDSDGASNGTHERKRNVVRGRVGAAQFFDMEAEDADMSQVRESIDEMDADEYGDLAGFVQESIVYDTPSGSEAGSSKRKRRRRFFHESNSTMGDDEETAMQRVYWRSIHGASQDSTPIAEGGTARALKRVIRRFQNRGGGGAVTDSSSTKHSLADLESESEVDDIIDGDATARVVAFPEGEAEDDVESAGHRRMSMRSVTKKGPISPARSALISPAPHTMSTRGAGGSAQRGNGMGGGHVVDAAHAVPVVLPSWNLSRRRNTLARRRGDVVAAVAGEINAYQSSREAVPLSRTAVAARDSAPRGNDTGGARAEAARPQWPVAPAGVSDMPTLVVDPNPRIPRPNGLNAALQREKSTRLVVQSVPVVDFVVGCEAAAILVRERELTHKGLKAANMAELLAHARTLYRRVYVLVDFGVRRAVGAGELSVAREHAVELSALSIVTSPQIALLYYSSGAELAQLLTGIVRKEVKTHGRPLVVPEALLPEGSKEAQLRFALKAPRVSYPDALNLVQRSEGSLQRMCTMSAAALRMDHIMSGFSVSRSKAIGAFFEREHAYYHQ